MLETQEDNSVLHSQALRDILMTTREVVLNSYAVIHLQCGLCSQKKREAIWQIILPQQIVFVMD